MGQTKIEPKWKRFERLVAGLHHALSPAGAAVEWGERIDGREFDVTIRFSELTYRFLTVIECKDYVVPVDDVDAFVTKSRGAHANKAVMVSSAGFQSGAMTVARQHGIDLYVLEESNDWPEAVKVIAETPALSISDVELISGSSVAHRFSNNPSALRCFVRCVTVRIGDAMRTLDETIMGARDVWEVGTSAIASTREVPLEPEAIVDVPFLDPFRATSVKFTAQVGSAKTIDTGGLDPSVVPPLFRFRNVLTGEVKTITSADLWIGFDTKIKKNHFYYSPFLGSTYYCRGVHGSTAKYVLVESYQHGTLFQCQFEQDAAYGRHFIEVNDADELGRLRRMLEQYMANQLPIATAPAVRRNDSCFCGSGTKYKKCHGR